MTPDDLPFDQITLLPDDWDEVEDGEMEIPGVRMDPVGEDA